MDPDPRQPHEEARARSFSPLAILAVTLLATLPFLAKPLHVDDPADLQHVAQIMAHPADPYGFNIDWDEGPHPAYRNYHPPLKYYYHAAVLTLLPFSEVTLHASYIPFVWMIAWSVASLARRFACPPFAVLVLWMLGPGYLPGQNVMLDVPAMALSLSATALFVRAIDADRSMPLVASAFLLGLAWLTKYSSLVYLPVWLAYLTLHGRWRRSWVLSIPLAMLAAWCGISLRLYGEVHLSVLAGSQRTSLLDWDRMLTATVFFAGAMPAAAILLFMRRRSALVFAVAVAAAMLLAWVAPPQRRVVHEPPPLDSINFIWWCFLSATGLALLLGAAMRLVSAARDGSLHSRSGRDDLFLIGWLFLALILGTFASPFLAMRRVVEAALPAWMFWARQGAWQSRWSRVAMVIVVLANSLVGFAVAGADYAFARVYRTMAADLADVAGSSRRIWTHGYWGWYHYAATAGFSRYVVGRELPPRASLLVIPGLVAKPAVLPAELRMRAYRVGSQPIPGRIPIRLMSHQAGAGYYGAAWGPLPYAWSWFPWELFSYFEIRDPSAGESAEGERAIEVAPTAR